MTTRNRVAAAVAASLGRFSIQSMAQMPPPADAAKVLADDYEGTSYSPYAARELGDGKAPSQLLWGDTHLHTALSFDAGAFGNRLGPEEAYRFALGHELVSSTGMPVRLSRPLDFLVVADHSDNMGFFPDLFAGKENIVSDPQGKDWYDRIQAGEGVDVALELIGLFSQGKFPEHLAYTPDSAPYKAAWQLMIDAAEKYNDPGNFTAFIGYEWTSLVQGANMHRVVILRDGEAEASRIVP